MPVSMTPDERRLAFEAKRLATETLIKIYLEQVAHARHLITAHLRLMFTLSLGALAGVVTLYGATLRLGAGTGIVTLDRLQVVLGLCALAALVASALLSATALRRAASAALTYVHDPFPGAAAEIAAIFEADELDERQVLRRLYLALDIKSERRPVFRPEAGLSTALLIIGLLLAGAPFLL